MIQCVSYGGGVQSTCIILLAIDGVIPKPDIIIFSDTGSELPGTYATVKEIKKLCAENDMRFETVGSYFEPKKRPDMTGSWKLHEWYLELGRLPMVGQPRCTFNFKIYPVRRLLKTLCDTTQPKPWASQSLGITTDEIKRMRESEIKWCKNDFPLIDLGMSRQDCVDYIAKHYPDLVVEKSGCFCCPYQSGKKWLKLKVEHPDLFDISRSMEIAAAKNGVKRGLWGAKSIIAFDHNARLTDFGFEIGQPLYEDAECDSGGCFL
tara:strand:- start:287 stop:1075 length:789 start_codon:yes stop_codon:yes gene_type:complete